MITEIIAVGTEITTGDTLDTNSYYISNRLLDIGIEVYYHISVDDCPIRLEKVINTALDRSDIIITTGGLGPTQDDLTKEIISKTLNLELKSDRNMESKIKNMFSSRNKSMTYNNIKQATKPIGSQFIENKVGTAPGIYIEYNNKIIIMLPGPPREMRPMYENKVLPLLREKLKGEMFYIKESINIVGIGESYLETRLLSMNLENKNIHITTFAGDGTVEIKIIGKGKNKDKIKTQVNLIIDKIKKEFKEYIYSFNDKSLEESVIDLLKERQYKLGLCESCTGGLISSKITSIPGASSVLDRAIVSYSNESKITELMVNQDTLEKYGAVSSETAYEMARGLLYNTSNLDIVLSITGIAGPDGSNMDKPIGLVYICIMDKYKHKIIKNKLSGDRLYIQNRATIEALDIIRKFLCNYY